MLQNALLTGTRRSVTNFGRASVTGALVLARSRHNWPARGRLSGSVRPRWHPLSSPGSSIHRSAHRLGLALDAQRLDARVDAQERACDLRHCRAVIASDSSKVADSSPAGAPGIGNYT